MILIINSLTFGFIGFIIGGKLGEEFLMVLLGIIGFFSPCLYVLEQIYKEVKKPQ